EKAEHRRRTEREQSRNAREKQKSWWEVLGVSSGATLEEINRPPKKFAVISSYANEMFTYSTPNIEALLRDTLARDVGLRLDTELFSTSAGGLLNGVASLTPSAMSPKSDAVLSDIAALTEAVAGVLSNVPVTFVAHPAQAATLRQPQFGVSDVLASAVLPEG